MNKVILFFKSKAFKDGYNSGGSELDNPYTEDATIQNLDTGMGASPHWDTNHKAFIDWRLGAGVKRYEQIDWSRFGND
jgi:hypothetical protein